VSEKILKLTLTTSQLNDLINALEDHREDFRHKAENAAYGFGLDAGYWNSRAEEIQELLDAVSSTKLTDL